MSRSTLTSDDMQELLGVADDLCERVYDALRAEQTLETSHLRSAWHAAQCIKESLSLMCDALRHTEREQSDMDAFCDECEARLACQTTPVENASAVGPT